MIIQYHEEHGHNNIHLGIMVSGSVIIVILLLVDVEIGIYPKYDINMD